jgi:hypothetical protein
MRRHVARLVLAAFALIPPAWLVLAYPASTRCIDRSGAVSRDPYNCSLVGVTLEEPFAHAVIVFLAWWVVVAIVVAVAVYVKRRREDPVDQAPPGYQL